MFQPMTPPVVPPAPLLTLLTTALVPMSTEEAIALSTSGCCPCAMGIFGACREGKPEHDQEEYVALAWRTVWLLLQVPGPAQYTVVDLPHDWRCRRCGLHEAESREQSVLAVCQRCAHEVAPADGQAYADLLTRYGW